MEQGADITRSEIEWLWHRYIPRGMLTLLTGDPQAGKTTVLCDIMAALSTGRPLPGETEGRAPENSWLLSSEDDAETTLIWRLENQGCDKTRIWITDEKVSLNTPAFQEMEENIRTHKLALVIIDTLTTWMGGDIDMNRANESMDFMNTLKQIAQRTNCAIVLVRHRRKGTPTDNKLHAGMGSIGFTAAVRSELAATFRTGGMRVIDRIKGNIGAAPPAQSYFIDPHPDPKNPHGVLRWGEAIEADLTKPKAPSTTPKALGLCQKWLEVELSKGSVPAAKLAENALRLGYSESTLARAKRGRVITDKDASGVFMCTLNPEPAA